MKTLISVKGEKNNNSGLLTMTHLQFSKKKIPVAKDLASSL